MTDIIHEAKQVFDIEIEALERVRDNIDVGFERAVRLIHDCRGKVIVTGMGKSGLIGRKIAATLSSTGTLAVFLHPAEGMHGDLGIVTADDVVITISKSGNSEEIMGIIPSIKMIGAKVVALVGELNSPLANKADIVIDVRVEREACPINLAPTASTTVTLALGDALAAVLLKMKGFESEDFALYHPGGRLGKRLLLRVKDLMHSGNDNPIVFKNTPVRDLLLETTSKAMGAVSVVGKDNELVGIVTDGDLRRAIQCFEDLLNHKTEDIMTHNPIKVYADEMAVKALELMENRPSQIMVLPVVDDNDKAIGMLRLHDLVKAGL